MIIIVVCFLIEFHFTFVKFVYQFRVEMLGAYSNQLWEDWQVNTWASPGHVLMEQTCSLVDLPHILYPPR